MCWVYAIECDGMTDIWWFWNALLKVYLFRPHISPLNILNFIFRWELGVKYFGFENKIYGVFVSDVYTKMLI